LWFSHESINIYKHCGIHNLLHERRSTLTEADVTSQAKACLQTVVARTLRYRGKTRFVNKDTDNSMRIRYLKAIFPDARFIHIVRDGRAVAFSLYKVDWWPDLRLWWAGLTPRDWQAAGKPPIELCARHWTREVTEIQAALETLDPSEYTQVRYEDLVREPLTSLQRLVAFCDLPWTAHYESLIRKVSVENLNYKWKQQLSTEEQNLLEDTLARPLATFGYPTQDTHETVVDL
jgi:hypothetical protein